MASKLRKSAAVAIVLSTAMGWPAIADDDTTDPDKGAAFCAEVNRVATSSEGVAQYDDRQVSYGLCMTGRLVSAAIADRWGPGAVVACAGARQVMFHEFARRFPDRDPKSVLGHC
jgi:hypothetical protein